MLLPVWTVAPAFWEPHYFKLSPIELKKLGIYLIYIKINND